MKKSMKLNNIISKKLVFLFLLPFFVLLACQTSLKNTKSVNDPEKIFENNTNNSINSEFLFKNGLYKQSVEVEYQDGKEKKSHDFNVVFKKTTTENFMYAYVGFGFKLFELKDNFKDEIQFNSSEKKIIEHKDFFLHTYHLTKEILNLKINDPRLKEKSFILRIMPENVPVNVSIIHKNKDIIVPDFISLTNDPHFRFIITTTEFNLVN